MIVINGQTNDISVDGESVATDAEVTAQIGAIPVIGDASETVKGVIEIATNAEVQTGTDTVKAVTPSGLLSAVIGLGQTWQDVTGSRVAGTTYTNSTGKPKFIIISTTITNSTSTFFINDINYCEIAFNTTTPIVRVPISAIVPVGATYKLTGTIYKWSELI